MSWRSGPACLSQDMAEASIGAQHNRGGVVSLGGEEPCGGAGPPEQQADEDKCASERRNESDGESRPILEAGSALDSIQR